MRMLLSGQVLWVALCLVAVSIQTQDGDASVLLQSEDVQADHMVRQRVGHGTKTGGAAALNSESYYNSGTFSYMVSAPGPIRQRTDPGETELSLTEQDMGEGADSRTTSFPYLERALGAAVASDGYIHRDEVLHAILKWNKAQLIREHARMEDVSFLQLDSRAKGAAFNPELDEAEKKLRKKELEGSNKTRTVPIPDDQNHVRMQSMQQEQTGIEDAQKQAKELSEKAQADAKEVMKANARDREEASAETNQMATELKQKKTQELSFKKKTKAKGQEKQKKEKAQEKRAKDAATKAQEAQQKATAIKEALEKAKVAAFESEAQEKVSKDSSEIYNKHANESREKKTILTRVKVMETAAEKVVAENVEKKSHEEAQKKAKESALKKKYKVTQKQLEIRGKELAKELLKKTAEEKQAKNIQEKSLKKDQTEASKALEQKRAQLATEASQKQQTLKVHQKHALEEIKKAEAEQNKRAVEQSVKTKEGATKTAERAKKRADRQVQEFGKVSKQKISKEAETKREKTAALEAAIIKKNHDEKKHKSETTREQVAKTGEERTQKAATLGRKDQDKRASVKDQKQRVATLTNEHKAKTSDLEKIHHKLNAQVMAALGVARASHTRLAAEMKTREAQMKKSEALSTRSHELNQKSLKKTFELVQKTNIKSVKAKRLSDEMKALMKQKQDFLNCPLNKYMNVLSDSGLIGSITEGSCKVSCRLDTNFANGLKIPCTIDEGGQAACGVVLSARAHSAASLGMKQYEKWKICQYGRMVTVATADSESKRKHKGKKVNFVDFMGQVRAMKGKGGNVPTGTLIDMLFAQCPDCGKRGKTGGMQFRFGEDSDTNGSDKPSSDDTKVNCDSTLKIKSDLSNIQPSATRGCLVNCKSEVPSTNGYSAKCSGSGEATCFVKIGQQYHQEVADAFFAWKTGCSRPLKRADAVDPYLSSTGR